MSAVSESAAIFGVTLDDLSVTQPAEDDSAVGMHPDHELSRRDLHVLRWVLLVIGLWLIAGLLAGGYTDRLGLSVFLCVIVLGTVGAWRGRRGLHQFLSAVPMHWTLRFGMYALIGAVIAQMILIYPPSLTTGSIVSTQARPELMITVLWTVILFSIVNAGWIILLWRFSYNRTQIVLLGGLVGFFAENGILMLFNAPKQTLLWLPVPFCTFALVYYLAYLSISHRIRRRRKRRERHHRRHGIRWQKWTWTLLTFIVALMVVQSVKLILQQPHMMLGDSSGGQRNSILPLP